MPILALEPDVFPDDLLHRAGLGFETDQFWWAMYTLPRREKELMRRLRARGFAFYAPLVPRRTRSPSGRLRTSYVPLFSNYVFLYGDENHRYQAMTTNCVSRWLVVPDGERLTHDLRQIKRLLESGAPLTPEARLAAGAHVRIRSGPMSGLEGVIVKRQNQQRLLIAINFLKQGVSVLLDDFQLEQID